MLKPKYVHGLSSEETSKSLLHRLKGDCAPEAWLDAGDGGVDDIQDDGGNSPVAWVWVFG